MKIRRHECIVMLWFYSCCCRRWKSLIQSLNFNPLRGEDNNVFSDVPANNALCHEISSFSAVFHMTKTTYKKYSTVGTLHQRKILIVADVQVYSFPNYKWSCEMTCEYVRNRVKQTISRTLFGFRAGSVLLHYALRSFFDINFVPLLTLTLSW